MERLQNCLPFVVVTSWLVLLYWRLWAAFVTVQFSVGVIVNTLYNISLSVTLWFHNQCCVV